MHTKIKDYTNDDLTYSIDNVTKVIAEYTKHLVDLTNELESRQNPNPPVQLELF
jgi:hypothetical protein